MTFESSVTEQAFDFIAVDDHEEDVGEAVVIGFGPLPSRVTGSGEATVSILDNDPPSRGACQADRETLCLQDSRYAVTVDWRKPDGQTGVGGVVAAARTNDSGLFTFFSPDNWEVLIKVLDGCALTGHVWVYAASTTDLGYTIRVTDTVTETAKEYRSEPGVPAVTITDATAFPDGCHPP